MGRKRKGQRSHKPGDLGPRLEQRRRSPYWTIDGRFWKRPRYVALRDPEAPGWPLRGERTTALEVAERWKWKYKDLWEKAGADRLLKRAERKPRALDVAIETYLGEIERQVGERTWPDIAVFFRNQVRPWATAQAITRTDTFTPAIGAAFLAELLRGGTALSTVFHSYRPRLSKFLRWVGYAEGLREYPIEEPAEEEVRFWTDEEVEALFDAAEGNEPLLLATLLGTGVRVSELCALQWRHFDRATNTVRVLKQVNSTRRLVPPKNKKIRTAVVLPIFWKHAPEAPEGVWVIDSGEARPLDSQTIRRRLRALYDRAGLREPGVCAHVWRHTYARIFMEETDGDIGLLCKSLGDSFDTTTKYYEHFGADKAAKLAAAKIYRTLGPRLA